MLNRSDGGLANLIIHELTHATLFIKDNVNFNENLASFIGEKGAFRFLEYKYGKDSKPYQYYMQSMSDEKLFNQYILGGAKRLDSLYENFNSSMSVNLKDSLKNNLIKQIFVGADSLPLFNKEKYQKTYKKNVLPNNAYFISYLIYDSKREDLEKEFQTKFNSDIKKYLSSLKKKYSS